jgi:hypothetical protein
MSSDYRPNDKMDRYSEKDLDDAPFSELSLADRMEVDAMLNQRDRVKARLDGRIPGAFIGGKYINHR